MPTRNLWKWSLVNNRRKTTTGGECPSKALAIAAADKAITEHGLHGTVTTLTSPKGIEFNYRPNERKSGQMVLERN